MTAENIGEFVLEQFNRLVRDLLEGTLQRNAFHRWEVDLMLDLEGCNMRDAKKKQALRRYHRALNKHFERGGGTPFSFSEYLALHQRPAPAHELEPEMEAAL